MPLHDFECESCKFEFEELHKMDELVPCPQCNSQTRLLVSNLADYSGLASKTVQYATRRAPEGMRDSHLQKLDKETSFLSKKITNQKVN